jgi:hypothetical protein
MFEAIGVPTRLLHGEIGEHSYVTPAEFEAAY